MSRFSFVLCRSSGEPVDDVRNTKADRVLKLGLNGVHQATIVLDLSDSIATEVKPGLSRLKVYREPSEDELAADPAAPRVLEFYGYLPVPNVNERAAAGIVTATFMDPRRVLSRRYTLGTETYDDIDQGAILADLVAVQNARAGGDTWIRDQGGVTTGITRDRTYDRRLVSDLFDEMTKVIDGPDIDIDPRDGWSETPSSRVMGNLRVYAEQGQDRPDAVFLYGEGYPANVGDVTRAYLDVTTLATFAGNDAQSVPLEQSYGSPASSGWGLLEEFEADPDISTSATLLQKATGRVKERESPREVIQVHNPTPEAPRALEHYELGDTISVSCRKGSMQFVDRALRVHGIEISLPATGDEAVTIVAAE